jgi:hypothetical protein
MILSPPRHCLLLFLFLSLFLSYSWLAMLLQLEEEKKKEKEEEGTVAWREKKKGERSDDVVGQVWTEEEEN